jgi:putative phosphoribosyl transferase
MRGARRVVVAVPVGAPAAVSALHALADEVVCPLQPADLQAVGAWYEDFDQVPDAVVARILGAARARHATPAGAEHVSLDRAP